MTIGLIALRAAKEQLAAAIATIKDELANPEICEQIKFEVFNIGSDLDDHLTELGKAMPNMFAEKAAAQEAQIGEGLSLIPVDALKLIPPAADAGPVGLATREEQESEWAEQAGDPSTAGNATLEEPGANEKPPAATVAAVAEEAPGPEVIDGEPAE